jgi:hypothetical protein
MGDSIRVTKTLQLPHRAESNQLDAKAEMRWVIALPSLTQDAGCRILVCKMTNPRLSRLLVPGLRRLAKPTSG